MGMLDDDLDAIFRDTATYGEQVGVNVGGHLTAGIMSLDQVEETDSLGNAVIVRRQTVRIRTGTIPKASLIEESTAYLDGVAHTLRDVEPGGEDNRETVLIVVPQ